MRARMPWGSVISLALVGCNYPALPPVGGGTDGPPGSAADGPHVTLDWQVAEPASVAPAPVYKPITPAPIVRIAPLLATIDANTAPAAFVDATYSADGTIAIPQAYLTQPWRLEYTLADGIPHEVQWQPADRRGHVVVPLIGRLTRDAVPSGAGYTITPVGGPSTYISPHVFTTGLWSDGSASVPSGTTVDYNFVQSVSLSGPNGAPDSAEGDRAFLIDYKIDGNGCRVATGGTTFDPTLHAGSRSTVTPNWETTTVTSHVRPFIFDVLDPLSTLIAIANSSLSFISIGVIPSSDIVGFAQPLSNVLPTPVMISLLECPINLNADIPVARPSSLATFANAAHIQLVGTRSVPGLNITLASGIEAILAVGVNGDFVVSFPAPFATQIALTTQLGKLALDGSASDQVSVGSPHGTFTLDFTPATGSGQRADDYDVLLRRITPTGLVTERIYTVTAPSVVIDSASLAPNADYLFEIRTIKGHPQASLGDFALTELPYGQAIAMARTIHTGPVQ